MRSGADQWGARVSRLRRAIGAPAGLNKGSGRGGEIPPIECSRIGDAVRRQPHSVSLTGHDASLPQWESANTPTATAPPPRPPQLHAAPAPPQRPSPEEFLSSI
ncbi:unnamed protein product, partial [Iphiclides podalirius]